MSTLSSNKANYIWIAATLLLALLTLLFLPLHGSFWLDETISVWITQSSLEDVWKRSLSYQGQSPLYFLILWLITQIGANSELALRLPSLLAAGLSLILITLIVKRFTNQWQAGLAAALTLLVQDEFLKFAMSVRPYSMAFAAMLCATLFWVYYLYSGKRLQLLAYIVSAIVMTYLHVSFLPVIGLHFLGYLLLYKTTRADLKAIIFSMLVIGLSAIPAILNLPKMEAHFETYRRIMFLPWYMFPTRIFLPSSYCVAFFFALVASALLVKGGALRGLKAYQQIIIWAVLWHFLPPLAFISSEILFNSPFILPRYYLWFLPGLSILSGCLIACLEPPKARYIFLFLFINFAFLLNASRQLQIEDWKNALAMQQLLQPNQPVLIHSGLAELNTSSWIDKPEHLDYLLTPARVYAPTLNSIPLPPEVDDSVKADFFWKQIKAFEDRPFNIMVLQVKRPNNPKEFVDEYYQRLLEENGYRSLGHANYGLVRVYAFQKIVVAPS